MILCNSSLGDRAQTVVPFYGKWIKSKMAVAHDSGADLAKGKTESSARQNVECNGMQSAVRTLSCVCCVRAHRCTCTEYKVTTPPRYSLFTEGFQGRDPLCACTFILTVSLECREYTTEPWFWRLRGQG